MDKLPKSMRNSANLTVETMPVGQMFYILPWELECDLDGSLSIAKDCTLHKRPGGTVEVGLQRNDQRELTAFIPRGIEYTWDERANARDQNERIAHIKIV